MAILSYSRQEVLALCHQAIEARKAVAAKAMQSAQEAANSDQKSSAGDKYETSRAMAHADRDRAARLWAEADDLKAQLTRIEGQAGGATAQVGTLITTEKAIYLLGVGIGKVADGPPPIYGLSIQAPAGQLLLGRKVGDTAKLPAGEAHILALG
jgi:hypothetical protein